MYSIISKLFFSLPFEVEKYTPHLYIHLQLHINCTFPKKVKCSLISKCHQFYFTRSAITKSIKRMMKAKIKVKINNNCGYGKSMKGSSIEIQWRNEMRKKTFHRTGLRIFINRKIKYRLFARAQLFLYKVIAIQTFHWNTLKFSSTYT